MLLDMELPRIPATEYGETRRASTGSSLEVLGEGVGAGESDARKGFEEFPRLGIQADGRTKSRAITDDHRSC